MVQRTGDSLLSEFSSLLLDQCRRHTAAYDWLLQSANPASLLAYTHRPEKIDSFCEAPWTLSET